jgi:hypothetical protein
VKGVRFGFVIKIATTPRIDVSTLPPRIDSVVDRVANPFVGSGAPHAMNEDPNSMATGMGEDRFMGRVPGNMQSTGIEGPNAGMVP